MSHLPKPTTKELVFAADGMAFSFSSERRRLTQRTADLHPDDHLAFARAVCTSVVAHYWKLVTHGDGRKTPLRLPPVPSIEISGEVYAAYASACARLDIFEAFYQIGELYTALLPADYRTRHGIYYTPPAIVRRLLDIVESEGADWGTARVLDPACGGAAFAAYIAQRMLAANDHLPAEARLRDLRARLVGLDIDPFATWLSAVLLDVVCLPVSREANTHVDGVIQFGDFLRYGAEKGDGFDLIVGNPPYGKVKLPTAERVRFQRSLHGHANLYGLFTDHAVSLVKPGGLIGFVTPTSFLGGEYFKNLRRFMLAEAPPVRACFISDREGVFSGVLQETVLTVYRRSLSAQRKKTPAVRLNVEVLSPHAAGSAETIDLGANTLPALAGAPWILPRARQETPLLRQLSLMPARLADYGYRVATGQLVWNRHKSQFRDQPGPECYPVLWAECIQPDGSFAFRAEKRNHRPYLEVAGNQGFLINQEPCVLVQRTTSKEQSRRLIATMIPNVFVVEQPGYVVENHVNMLVPTRAHPTVSLAMLAALLNSETIDRVFRCISGSVAVSAYELENLPLPSPDQLLRRLPPSRAQRSSDEIGAALRTLYHAD